MPMDAGLASDHARPRAVPHRCTGSTAIIVPNFGPVHQVKFILPRRWRMPPAQTARERNRGPIRAIPAVGRKGRFHRGADRAGRSACCCRTASVAGVLLSAAARRRAASRCAWAMRGAGGGAGVGGRGTWGRSDMPLSYWREHCGGLVMPIAMMLPPLMRQL